MPGSRSKGISPIRVVTHAKQQLPLPQPFATVPSELDEVLETLLVEQEHREAAEKALAECEGRDEP
jgi:hypothetical protein